MKQLIFYLREDYKILVEIKYFTSMFLNIARQGYNRWWRYLISIALVFLGMAIFQVPLLLVGMFYYVKKYGEDADPIVMMEYLQAMDYRDIGVDLNFTLFLAILGFAGGLLALWLCLKVFHKRKMITLITPFEQINWSKIFFAFGLWMLFTFIIEGISYYISPGDYSLQFNLSTFIPLLVISLLFLPIQTSFEELFFRGYFLQGISMISTYRWIPLVITSVLFGAMHLANPEIEKFGTSIMLTYYIGTGLFLGIITLMDDSLELALGIHAATNIYASTIVTSKDRHCKRMPFSRHKSLISS